MAPPTGIEAFTNCQQEYSRAYEWCPDLIGINLPPTQKLIDDIILNRCSHYDSWTYNWLLYGLPQFRPLLFPLPLDLKRSLLWQIRNEDEAATNARFAWQCVRGYRAFPVIVVEDYEPKIASPLNPLSIIVVEGYEPKTASPLNPLSSMASPLDPLSSRTRLEWLVALDTESRPTKNYRRTSIIGTIGPKTNSVEKINELRKAGLNVVRMNFSHGSYEYHQSVVDHAKEAERTYPGRPLAVALDTKGPEIRTGNTVGDADIPISEGTELNITTDEKYATACDDKNMYVDYKNITKVIEAGRIIYVDDGVLAFQVLKVVDDKTLHCRCINNGKISSKKGVNLPKTDVDLPALSEKDKNDLRFGVKNKVDMVFASFIRRASDVTAIREVLGEDGKDIQIISKIENQQGVNNFDEILEVTDGVMVARGDLGIEIPPAQVFIAQKMMISKCNLAGKPVICATQMLESMTYNPRPTRAEVSDVGNAVLDGADCVMLSGETAKGNYAKESVSMMHETCLLAERAIPYVSHFDELRSLCPRPCDTIESCAMAAVSSSLELNAGAILVLTTSGKSARLISKYRPVCPIIMVTRHATASRYSHLYRGVYPFLFPQRKPDFNKQNWQEDVDNRLKWGIEQAIKLNILSRGDPVVCVQGWRGGMGHTNTIRIVPAEEDLGLAE